MLLGTLCRKDSHGRLCSGSSWFLQHTFPCWVVTGGSVPALPPSLASGFGEMWARGRMDPFMRWGWTRGHRTETSLEWILPFPLPFTYSCASGFLGRPFPPLPLLTYFLSCFHLTIGRGSPSEHTSDVSPLLFLPRASVTLSICSPPSLCPLPFLLPPSLFSSLILNTCPLPSSHLSLYTSYLTCSLSSLCLCLSLCLLPHLPYCVSIGIP